jgi:hypothetical protein
MYVLGSTKRVADGHIESPCSLGGQREKGRGAQPERGIGECNGWLCEWRSSRGAGVRQGDGAATAAIISCLGGIMPKIWSYQAT